MLIADFVKLLRDLERQALETAHQNNRFTPHASPAETMVASVVYRQGSASIGEIAAQTGFVQSHVSAVVARLQEYGVLVSAPDPVDRRRTLVSFEPVMAERIQNSLLLDTRAFLLQRLGDEAYVDEVMQTLESLRERLGDTAPQAEPV